MPGGSSIPGEDSVDATLPGCICSLLLIRKQHHSLGLLWLTSTHMEYQSCRLILSWPSHRRKKGKFILEKAAQLCLAQPAVAHEEELRHAPVSPVGYISDIPHDVQHISGSSQSFNLVPKPDFCPAHADQCVMPGQVIIHW